MHNNYRLFRHKKPLCKALNTHGNNNLYMCARVKRGLISVHGRQGGTGEWRCAILPKPAANQHQTHTKLNVSRLGWERYRENKFAQHLKISACRWHALRCTQPMATGVPWIDPAWQARPHVVAFCPHANGNVALFLDTNIYWQIVCSVNFLGKTGNQTPVWLHSYTDAYSEPFNKHITTSKGPATPPKCV